MNKKSLEIGTRPSKIRELYEFAKKLKSEIGDENVYDFSLGNPSTEVPYEYQISLAMAACNETHNPNHQYTSSAGNMDTRDAIANYVNGKFGSKLEGKYIYMTCGASSSLAIAFNALIEAGEEVIVIVPYFPEYKVIIQHAGGVMVESYADKHTFYPGLDDIEKKINERTRVVLINSPNNPTGVIYPKKEIEKLAKLLLKKQKEYGHEIYLISDEPYRELIYTNEKHEMITNYYPNSIITYSYSKSLSIPGDRIGYVAVGNDCKDKDLIMAAFLGAARSLGYVCAPTPMQKALVTTNSLQLDLTDYRHNRNELYKALKEIGYELAKPSGAFYLFIKSLEEDANKFSENAKKFNLIIVPSDSFGMKGYARIAYCVPSRRVDNSIEAFRKLYEFYNKK